MSNSEKNNLSYGNTNYGSSNHSGETVYAELVNDDLESQNHRMQKNLVQQEKNIQRYWHNENDIQMILNNERNKYSCLANDEMTFLISNNIWRDGDVFYYQPSLADKVISGTKEAIEIEVSSRNTFNLHFVDDLNDIKGIRFNTVYVSIKSIDVQNENIYDPNSYHGKIHHNGNMYNNSFVSTSYFYYRRYYQSMPETPSFTRTFAENLSTLDNPAYFLVKIMARYFKNLKSDDPMLLIHHQDVADVMWNHIITEIYGQHNVKVLNDEILKTQSVKEILDKTLYIRITSIPDDLEKQNKLKELMTSVSIGYDRIQLLITLNEAHPFLEEFLSATDVIFLDSMENIIKKLNAVDKIDLIRQIRFSLSTFARELSAIGSNSSPEYYDNSSEKQRYLNLTSKNGGHSISRNDILSPFDNSIDTAIPLDSRRKHMMITGQTGSGKSELAKSCMYEDIERDDGVVICLEPHGDLAEQVAKLPMEKERLVYIDLTLHESMTPSINLLYLTNKSEKEIQARAKVIVSVVRSVNDTETFNGAMEDVLYNIVCVLLRAGRSDFFEVLRYLNTNTNATDLLKLGKNSPNMLEKEFFTNDFENMKPTRDAVKRRVKKLLSDPLLANLFNGSCTIDLERLMNEKGKVLIFRIKKSEMLDSYVYFARFIIGLIQTIALKRANIPEADRVPTYCYIDEFHNFITPTIEEILTESRKYALYMTLINQSVSQIKNSKLKDIILSNTNVKLIGKNSNKTLAAMNDTLNTKLEDVEKLATGEFYLSIGNGDVRKVKNSDALLNGNVDISASEWNELMQYQLKHYYRNININDDEESSQVDISKKVDDFINAIKSINIDYFDNVKNNQALYAELIENFNDHSDGASGYIAKQDFYLYFNLVYEANYFNDNLELLKLLRRDDFFKQDVNKNKTSFGKKRYLIS